MPDLNPLDWLGGQVQQAATNFWITAMMAIWGAGQFLLKAAFLITDKLTAPPLTDNGPLGKVLGITLWLGLTLAGVMVVVQLCLAIARRDGQALGRLGLGIVQFAFVTASFVVVGGTIVEAAGQLAQALRKALLDVDSFSQWTPIPAGLGRNVTDAAVATVLGLTSLFLLIPASFLNLIVALVASATLMVLLVTTPITAGGLLSDVGRPWFWKQLRWFICCALISPQTALVLGIGSSVGKGLVLGAPEDSLAAVGTGVVSIVLVAIGSVTPIAMFRLFAWIDPSTASGAALRQSWSDAGGFSGVMGGSKGGAGGSSQAAQQDDSGRAQGEAGAESQTGGRWASALGGLGAAAGGSGRGLLALGSPSMAYRAVDMATDILGPSGVGHPAYSLTYADEGAQRGSGRRQTQSDPGADPGADSGAAPTVPTPSLGSPPPPGAGGAGGAAGAGGAVDASSVAAAAV